MSGGGTMSIEELALHMLRQGVPPSEVIDTIEERGCNDARMLVCTLLASLKGD